MDILGKLGSIAGIAGIGFGIFLFIFKDVVRKSIFPSLTKEHAYKTIRLILILTWSMAISGLLAWLYSKNIDSYKSNKDEPNFRKLILEKPETIASDSSKINSQK